MAAGDDRAARAPGRVPLAPLEWVKPHEAVATVCASATRPASIGSVEVSAIRRIGRGAFHERTTFGIVLRRAGQRRGADRRFQAVLHQPRRRDKATSLFANLQPLLRRQRVRQAFIRARTAPANQIRGLPERHGLIVPEARR